MAEYIDREQLLELINEDCKYQNPTNEYTRGCNEVCDWAIKTIKNIPTADVVPKSEVAKVLDEIEKTIRGALVLVGFSYKHNQKEIQGKQECYEDFLGYIAELKKKYTESGDNK